MTEQKIKEKEYLINISRCKLAEENPFIIRIGDDKELYAVGDAFLAASDSGDYIDEFFKKIDVISNYKALYDIAVDLTEKISFSLETAIENTYSDEILSKFDAFHSKGKKEWYVYYNIENAVFRIEALWDILAQIYNIKYALENDVKRVYHNRIFSKEKIWLEKYWKNGMPKNIELIADYYKEEDNTDIDGMWKGNYEYVNSLRNDMTHKISIAITLISSYAFTFKMHPAFILKRTCECFFVLQDFINEACKIIIEEIA